MFFRATRWWLVVVVCFSRAFVAQAEPYEFGLEQELRNPLLYVSPSIVLTPIYRAMGWGDARGRDFFTLSARRQFLQFLRWEAAKHPEDMVVNGDHVSYPKLGWGFKVGTDYTVIETGLEPVTLEKLKSMRDVLQRDLFDLAKRARLQPHEWFSQGHMHVGLKNFDGDATFFLNYIIDHVNHSELANGAFGFDGVNAHPVIQDRESREGFKRLLADFDAGKVRTIDEIRDRLAELGMNKIPGSIQGAINVKTRYPTIELRMKRAYRSVDDMIDYVELQQIRLNHLKAKTGRIEFLDTGSIESVTQGVAQFHAYVTEAGGEWERYKKLLPLAWQRERVRPSKAFLHNPDDLTAVGICRLLFMTVLM